MEAFDLMLFAGENAHDLGAEGILLDVVAQHLHAVHHLFPAGMNAHDKALGIDHEGHQRHVGDNGENRAGREHDADDADEQQQHI